ncbi:MAG: response regulator [Lautropia sp.]
MVDDDRRLTTLALDYLTRHGFQVTLAATGAEALQRLDAQPFDLVTLDLMLPDLDGLEVCRRLRSRDDTRRSTPVLMLTARGDTIDRIIGLELGADDYLPKPFEPRELLARINALLRRPPLPVPDGAAVTASLRFGSLTIDRDTREVRRDGVVCPLTAHQYTVLLTLAERAGRVVSRDALAAATAALSANESGSRAIDIHIARIRAAIEDDPTEPQRIRTVRGGGYMMLREQP